MGELGALNPLKDLRTFINVLQHPCLQGRLINTRTGSRDSSYKHVFTAEWKTVWILSKWLRQKPADLDPYCFQKMINLDHQPDKG